MGPPRREGAKGAPGIAVTPRRGFCLEAGQPSAARLHLTLHRRDWEQRLRRSLLQLLALLFSHKPVLEQKETLVPDF